MLINSLGYGYVPEKKIILSVFFLDLFDIPKYFDCYFVLQKNAMHAQ